MCDMSTFEVLLSLTAVEDIEISVFFCSDIKGNGLEKSIKLSQSYCGYYDCNRTLMLRSVVV